MERQLIVAIYGVNKVKRMVKEFIVESLWAVTLPPPSNRGISKPPERF